MRVSHMIAPVYCLETSIQAAVQGGETQMEHNKLAGLKK